MAYSSSPPRDAVRSMFLCSMLPIILMEATVYSLDPLLHSSSSPLLLVMEPASHPSSPSTMVLYRMAWTISHCQHFIYKKYVTFSWRLGEWENGVDDGGSPRGKKHMVAAYNPIQGIVSLTLVRSLIIWPHFISDPMVVVLWQWKNLTRLT